MRDCSSSVRARFEVGCWKGDVRFLSDSESTAAHFVDSRLCPLRPAAVGKLLKHTSHRATSAFFFGTSESSTSADLIVVLLPLSFTVFVKLYANSPCPFCFFFDGVSAVWGRGRTRGRGRGPDAKVVLTKTGSEASSDLSVSLRLHRLPSLPRQHSSLSKSGSSLSESSGSSTERMDHGTEVPSDGDDGVTGWAS